MAPLSDAANEAVTRVNALVGDDKARAAKAIKQANPDLFPVSDPARTRIWMTLLIGMFALGIVAVIASTILAMNGKDFSAVIALGSGVVGGLVGLFAKSPTAD